MSKELIRLRDIRMAFDDEVVLNDLNLYINDKEFLTLLGPAAVARPRRCVLSAALRPLCRRRPVRRCED